jgi:DNA-binding transcriptional ArsR family regulator
MTVYLESSPFGSRTRTRVLVTLCLLTESYAREMAKLLDVPLSGVQRALASLERDGLVSARSAGRTRLFRLEPRYFAYEDLRRYLSRLAEPDDELQERVATIRRRPRRTGKPL